MSCTPTVPGNGVSIADSVDPGNERPKVIRDRQKFIDFRNAASRSGCFIEPWSGGRMAELFDAAFFLKIPLFVGLQRLPSDWSMHRHPREIAAISVLDSRIEAVSWAAYRYPKNSEIGCSKEHGLHIVQSTICNDVFEPLYRSERINLRLPHRHARTHLQAIQDRHAVGLCQYKVLGARF